MLDIVFSQSGPGGVKRSGARTARALAGLLVCAALLGGWAAIPAPGADTRALPVPAGQPHEPLAGKACIDCHKQAAPSNGRCLLTREQMCVLCHKIPAVGGPARLAEPSAPLCFKCHTKDAFKGGYVHGPFAAGACLTCHSPHGGNDFRMVRVPGGQMCLTCHQDMEAQLTNARFQHKATASGCTDCHSPHASEQRYQLRKAVPDLCAGCHESIFSGLKAAVVKHSPVTEKAACLNCHDPHMAENEWLLPVDGLDICLRCHDESIEVDRHKLALMGPLLEANARHHGPIQSRECSGCHNPHGSPYFRLLTDHYPQRLYAPFFESNYALCFRCHDSKLVQEERTTALTGFRDSDRNLHFIHVKKSSMGRTCRLCHEAHASSLPKYMRASVPFGTWDLPIKFKITENGGSCEPGCHAAQKYERKAAPTAGP